MCVVTREVRPKGELLRWFVGPDNTHWPDWTGGAPVGDERAVYTLPDQKVVRDASTRGTLDGPVDVLLERFREQGERELFQRLGLAKRAGKAHVGQRAVDRILRDRSDGLLLIAQDAGNAARKKYTQQAGRKGLSCIYVRTGEKLGRPFGREFVSTAVITGRTFSRRIMFLSRALDGCSESIVSVAGAKNELESTEDTR
jgi:ribosomal protein L7Ae-like RNA K-turn-binding protein